MQDFSSKHIIPSMEQKIRVLNQQVFYIHFSLFWWVWCFSPPPSSIALKILITLSLYVIFPLFRFLQHEKALETKLKIYGGEKGKKIAQILAMVLCMLCMNVIKIPVLLISFFLFFNIVFVFLVKGMVLAPPNPKFEFWGIMLSC